MNRLTSSDVSHYELPRNNDLLFEPLRMRLQTHPQISQNTSDVFYLYSPCASDTRHHSRCKSSKTVSHQKPKNLNSFSSRHPMSLRILISSKPVFQHIHIQLTAYANASRVRPCHLNVLHPSPDADSYACTDGSQFSSPLIRSAVSYFYLDCRDSMLN